MYEVFTKLLNMSLTASLLVIAVILLRFLLKKVPKRSICILWVLVAFRLIVPFSITSSASVFNVVHMGSDAAERMAYFQYNGKTEKPTLTFDIPSGENADAYSNLPTSEIIGSSESFEPATAEKHTAKIYLPAVMMVWALGVAAILIYAMISFFELRKNVAASIPQTKNIYICDEINIPFILGIVRPRIYLPSSLKDGVKEHVIAHEQAHLKRFDHLWKPIGFLLLAVYWFNPILWIAYVLFCRDIEAACDEKVIEDFDRQWRVKYSEALLSCAVERRMITVCPLAFGETNVKGRVKGVLNYKKPAFWVTGVTAIICVIMAIGFLTNPKYADDPAAESTPEETPQIVEDISTETVAVNREMSDKEAKQLRGLAKDISLDDIDTDNYQLSMTCYDEERDLQVILFNKEKDSCILATVPWSFEQNEMYRTGKFHEGLQSKPLEFLQTLGQVKIKDFSALLPEQKELDLYVGKTIRDLKKDGFIYSGYEYSGHI